MSETVPRNSRTLLWIALAVAVVMVVSLGIWKGADVRGRFGMTVQSVSSEADQHIHNHVDHDHGAGPHDSHEDHHAGHDHDELERASHDEDGHGEEILIAISPQARANMRLQVDEIQRSSFTKYIEVPAVITAWPGRTHVSVTSPLTGVIISIGVSRGELIRSGEPMFRLRLTHQDLVKTQESFLTQLGQLDVEQKEIQRLSAITSSGAVAGKAMLAREYERDKLLASVRAARQAMLLHGLNEDQVTQIERTRQLVREIVVMSPEIHEDRSLHHDSHDSAASFMNDGPITRVASMMQPPPLDHPPHVDTQFLVSELSTRRGQAVVAGDLLAELSDYSELLIEGQAFQRDGDVLRRAADSGAPLQAVMDSSGDAPDVLDDLKVAYIGNEIGKNSRALPFFVGLVNEIERSEMRGSDRYVSWRYKPGQRLKLRLPVETESDVVVVPKSAVAEEGLDRFVFIDHGDHFVRVPVRILSRDSMSVALANTDLLRPGQTVATSGAHQLQMALKNSTGGAIDPHAGHRH